MVAPTKIDLTSSSSICAFKLDSFEDTETTVEVVETENKSIKIEMSQILSLNHIFQNRFNLKIKNLT